MIRGVHAMFYSANPAELRAFFRDQLRLPFTDVGDGWLIFDLPSGDLGVHPTNTGPLTAGGHPTPPHNTPAISFFCDDIQRTVADLKSRGVEFTSPVTDQGFGLVTHLKAPGDLVIQLYQPRYKKNLQHA